MFCVSRTVLDTELSKGTFDSKNMTNINIAIIAKDKLAYKGEAEAVFVPTQTGIIEVMPEHMQLVSALKAGDLIVKTKDNVVKLSRTVFMVG